MHKNIEVTYYLQDLYPQVQESVKQYVEENIENKMDAYFKKVLSHPDAVIHINVNIQKNGANKFDGRFTFTLNGKPLRYQRDGEESFKNIHDLVNHAFDYVKNEIASQKEAPSIVKKDKTQQLMPQPE